MSYRMNRRAYELTTGDRVRLAEPELFIEIERDLTTKRTCESATFLLMAQRYFLF